jgi:hypothetical protein
MTAQRERVFDDERYCSPDESPRHRYAVHKEITVCTRINGSRIPASASDYSSRIDIVYLPQAPQGADGKPPQ